MDSTTSQLLFITALALAVVSVVAVVVALRGRPDSTLPILWPPTFFHPLPEDAQLLIPPPPVPAADRTADRADDTGKTRINEITRPLNADPLRTNEIQQLAPEADVTKPNVIPTQPAPSAPSQDDADATGKIRIEA